MRIIKHTFVTGRFFLSGAVVVVLFVTGFIWPLFVVAGQVAIILWISVTLAEIVLLFHPVNRLTARRQTPGMLSLGSENQIFIDVFSRGILNRKVTLIDELPFQFQIRDFSRVFDLKPEDHHVIIYSLVPKERGEYHFGNIITYSRILLRLVQRRTIHSAEAMVPVYPSVMEMKKYGLSSLVRQSSEIGFKKVRRVGHNYEFDQIKEYVMGDDYRSINWKATGRRHRLMVNQYEDERSQEVYTVIDKGSSMLMPFDKMSLLDYSINTGLVISNVALQKKDKAGLIVFSREVETFLTAANKPIQLRQIIERLYNISPGKYMSNYEKLYSQIKSNIKQRSLILLFTNLESTYSMERILPILRRIRQLHLLVVVLFRNTELARYYSEKVEAIPEIYYKTAARRYASEKIQIARKLNSYGIQTFHTAPRELSINTINKYIELKSRGMF